MAISFLRVDDRIIHGQITTRWSQEYPCDAIVAVNDHAANNPIIKNSLKKFNFSFKNNKPRKTANKIEVSLTEETTAIGRYKHAHTTIP